MAVLGAWTWAPLSFGRNLGARVQMPAGTILKERSMRKTCAALAMVSAVGLAGCVVEPDYRRGPPPVAYERPPPPVVEFDRRPGYRDDDRRYRDHDNGHRDRDDDRRRYHDDGDRRSRN